jgi:hypothetical protein
MSFLFDISPDDVPDAKRKRGARKAPAEEPPTDRPLVIDVSSRSSAVHGKCDGEYACPDDRCGSTTHDITHIDRGAWRIECAFCGTGQWVEAEETEGEFRFPNGRFEGLTVSEVAAQRNGLQYVRFVAEKDPSQAVRDACRTWLDSQAFTL